MRLCACACVLFICVGVQAMCVCVVALTELKTSDRTGTCCAYLVYSHSLPRSLILTTSMTVFVDEPFKMIFLSPGSAGSQVSGLCLYWSLYL